MTTLDGATTLDITADLCGRARVRSAERTDMRRLKFELALDQLRADNRRLNLELAAARSQRDSCSSASPLVGVTGRPELWCGGPCNYSDVD